MKMENGYVKLAEMLGVEFGKPFNVYGDVEYERYNPYHFEKDGLYDCHGDERFSPLNALLCGVIGTSKADVLTPNDKKLIVELGSICGDVEEMKVRVNLAGNKMVFFETREGVAGYIPIKKGVFEYIEIDKWYKLSELGVLTNEKL